MIPAAVTATVEESERIAARLAPTADSGEPGRVNRRLVTELAEEGLFGRIFAKDGVTAAELCAIRQGLARVDIEVETAFAVQGLGATPIHLNGTAALREEWMPQIEDGSAVAAFALTEPGAGSDAAGLTLSATRDGETFRIEGEKVYISNAPDADIYTVFARTTADAGARGVTAFAVPGDAPGLSGEAIEMISPHPIGRLRFDGVVAGADQVLGEVDRGFRVAMETLDLFRPSVGALAVGMAEAALRIAVGHAAEREAFGVKIAEFQGVSHQLAEVRTRIEAAAHLIYEAATTYDNGDRDRVTGTAAMAKLYATETAQLAVDVAIQILGARALESGSPLARLYAGVRAPRIYEGTSEIQRNIIARELFAGRI